LEVEIRISDIRSLLPYGSSLVPFWLHSERQLNQVENGINTEIERQKNRISETHLRSAEGNKEKVQDRGESKVNADMRKFSPENSSAIVDDTDASIVQKALHDEATNVDILNVKQVSVDGHLTQLHVVAEEGKEIDGTQIKESPKSGFQSGEDVDMDIDMEVEDLIPARKRTLDMGGQTVNPSEQLAQPNVSVAGESLGAGSEFIPPPPEEEWIPPPPPDNEGIPPPPPEEPPESLCPPPLPAEPEPLQPIYSDPYNLTYVESNMNYYGNTNTGNSASSFYEHADGSQISVLNAPVYYAAVSDVQPAVASANSAVYYGLQNGGVPVVPADSVFGSSGFQAASALVNCDMLSSNQIATADASAGASSLSNQSVEPHVSGAKTEAVPVEASTSVISAPATVSVKEYVSVPSFSTVGTSVSVPFQSTVSDTSTAVPKAQAKGNILDHDGHSMSYIIVLQWTIPCLLFCTLHF